MTKLQKGLVLAALQCGAVLSLTGKLVIDRATQPRVWVRAMPFDPEMPIRGRYLALRLAPEPDVPYFVRLSDARVVFFVPEKLTDLEKQQTRPDVWAEVTIPKEGPPRPIRLGVKKDERIEPLNLR